MLYEYLCHLVNATACYLEPFQITALLYESGLLLRVIRISVKVRIDVTLYDELLFTSIIEKILSPLDTKDKFDRCHVIHSRITIVPLDQLMARHTSCAVHSIAYCRAYV